MISVCKLKGIIAEKGLSQRKVARALGVSENTFYRKMHAGVFNSNEMNALIKLLNIDNPGDIFFPKDGA